MLAGNADQSRADNRLVLELVSQFDLMQQHMFGRFQECLLIATRQFALLHREQLGAVQKELADLQDIVKDLRAFQNQLTKNLAQVLTSPLASAANSDEEPIENGLLALSPSAAAQLLPGAGLDRDTTVEEEASSETPALTTSSGGDVHAWLNERIASLQDEQKSRWSKLLGKIHVS